MKRTVWIIACLLLLSALMLVACDQAQPIETQPSATVADTKTPDEEATESATTPAETEPGAAVTETEPSETTEAVEETTVFELPVVNPDEAAAAGLPTDAESYTVGGETPASDPKAQYDYLTVYAHA